MRAPSEEQRVAYAAMAVALRQGRLKRADEQECSSCGEPASELHHANGYAPEHRLDVTPLCVTCHRRLHRPSHAPTRRWARWVDALRPQGQLWGLRHIREARGLTISGLWRLTGISPGALMGMERGLDVPLPGTAELLASALDVGIDELGKHKPGPAPGSKAARQHQEGRD